MELRPSGKIAVGIVAGLGTIGALHLFLFKDRATAYGEARSRYDTTISTYTGLGSAPSTDSTAEFKYQALKFRLSYWEAVSNLRVYVPRLFYPDPAKVTVPQMRQPIWDALAELDKRRIEGNAGNGPKLPFLSGSNASWGLTDTLPPRYSRQGIAVEDDVTNLVNEDKLIKSLDETSPVYRQRVAGFGRLLAGLGVNPVQRDYVEKEYGINAGILYMLNRLQQVEKALPSDYFAGKTRDERMQMLYDLFQIKWPLDTLGNENPTLGQRQMEALLLMVDAGKAAGIDEFSFAKLHPVREIFWQDPETILSAAPTPVSGGAFAGGGGGGGLLDEAFMNDPTMGGGDPLPGGRDGGGRQAVGPAAPVQAGESVAFGTPIEVRFKGTNQAVATFIYSLTASRSPFELDRLRIITARNEEGKVNVEAYFNVIAYARIAGGTTEGNIDVNIVTAKQQLAEVALTQGVRKFAVADGFVIKDGETYRLAAPSPTAIPGAPTPVAPPPAPPAQ